MTARISEIRSSDISSAADFNIDAAALSQRRISVGAVEPAFEALVQQLLAPLVASITLLMLLIVRGAQLEAVHVALALAVFLTTNQLVSAPRQGAGDTALRLLGQMLPRFVFEWCCVVAALAFIGMAVGASKIYPPALFFSWSLLSPLIIVFAQVSRARLPAWGRNAPTRSHIVIGANEVGLELNRRAVGVSDSKFMGFFDDRDPLHLAPSCREQLQGTACDVVDFVQRHTINTVYVSLPLAATPQINNLLNQLRDTAASVYLVPDIFSFDVIQARFVNIDGMPAVSLYDTPFHGVNEVVKRSTDIVFALLAVLLLWPLMLAIAIGVKLTSPGPVLFRQRRYGINGEEIVVYKFRSMTVCEDGATVVQATRRDNRVTPLGQLLRRTSMDELPQLFNVLEGTMSLVGPRPHAVAHNELYRKLIHGYMLRHKVRPGMTGWAQVNGLRGETDTVEKMRRRVDYDLDYLKRWSLWFDVRIIFRTIRLLLSDTRAY